MSGVRVLLTDDDNGSLLVECADMAAAQDLASAAVFSDGGVSAWLLPDDAVSWSREMLEALREGHGLVVVGRMDPASHGPTCSECTGGNRSPHVAWEV